MKFTAEMYSGRKIGNSGFNYRTGVQIVATDEKGKRRYVFSEPAAHGRTYKTPCLKMCERIAHYKSGLNKKDAADIAEAFEDAEKTVAEWNLKGTHE